MSHMLAVPVLWHNATMITAVAIFAATYLVIAIGRLPGYRLDRAGAALLGASLMVGFGVLPLEVSLQGNRLRHYHLATGDDDRCRQPAAVRFLPASEHLGGDARKLPPRAPRRDRTGGRFVLGLSR